MRWKTQTLKYTAEREDTVIILFDIRLNIVPNPLSLGIKILISSQYQISPLALQNLYSTKEKWKANGISFFIVLLDHEKMKPVPAARVFVYRQQLSPVWKNSIPIHDT